MGLNPLSFFLKKSFFEVFLREYNLLSSSHLVVSFLFFLFCCSLSSPSSPLFRFFLDGGGLGDGAGEAGEAGKGEIEGEDGGDEEGGDDGVEVGFLLACRFDLFSTLEDGRGGVGVVVEGFFCVVGGAVVVFFVDDRCVVRALGVVFVVAPAVSFRAAEDVGGLENDFLGVVVGFVCSSFVCSSFVCSFAFFSERKVLSFDKRERNSLVVRE